MKSGYGNTNNHWRFISWRKAQFKQEIAGSKSTGTSIWLVAFY